MNSPTADMKRDRVILLGAGASAEAGIPTASKLLEAVRARLAGTDAWPYIGPVMDAVIGALQQQNAVRGRPFDPVDIEAMFAALELLANRSSNPLAPFVTSWSPGLIEAQRPRLESYVSHVCQMLEQDLSRVAVREERMSFAVLSGLTEFERALQSLISAAFENRAEPFQLARMNIMLKLCELCWIRSEHQVAYLKPLLESANARSLWIATLNFDNTLELAAESLGTTVDIGIRPERQVVFDPSSRIKLAKLHGSLNWAVKDAWSIDVKEAPLPTSRVIFGAENKLRVDGPYLDLLLEFRNALDSTDTLEICGYSFRDAHINHTLLRWLDFGENRRRCTVIDPTATFESVLDSLSANTGFILPGGQVPTPVPGWLRSCLEIRNLAASEWALAPIT
jgi:hypothetical protein